MLLSLTCCDGFVVDMLQLVIVLLIGDFFMCFRVDSSNGKVSNRRYSKHFLLSNV